MDGRSQVEERAASHGQAGPSGAGAAAGPVKRYRRAELDEEEAKKNSLFLPEEDEEE